MRFLFMLALVVSTCTATQGKPYDAFIKCDDKGKRFAVVLPTGTQGNMKIKKLEHEHPQHFTIQRRNVTNFKGYVCMQFYGQLFFYTEIELFTVARTKNIKNFENFTWLAEVSEVSILSGKPHEVLRTYIWSLGDFGDFCELSNVNVAQLKKILR